MARRICLALSLILVLALSAVAVAATRPRPHTDYFFVSHEHFSITLDTKAAGVLAAGRPAASGGRYPPSGVLILCPTSANGAVAELHLGFPGARLKASRGHYRFKLTYTWKQPSLAVILGPGAGTATTTGPAKVSISGSVVNAKLITGTVSVQEPSCELPRSSFRATVVSTIPN